MHCPEVKEMAALELDVYEGWREEKPGCLMPSGGDGIWGAQWGGDWGN